MTTKYPTQCVACKHLRGREPGKQFTCGAFPGGIPNSIVLYGGDHRQPRKGDHGITFEQKEGAEAARAMEDWAYVFEGGGAGGGN